MHYIYSQSLIVGAMLCSWDSLLSQTPRTSPISCSELLINARKACTNKGIPLPVFGNDPHGELDEITLCTSEIVAAHLVKVKLNTVSEAINNIGDVPLELDKSGLEIISDSLRLLRRDLEGLRCHFLCKMWMNQDQLRVAYRHVDIMLRFMDYALHGEGEESIIEHYQNFHSEDHIGGPHINVYALSESKQLDQRISHSISEQAYDAIVAPSINPSPIDHTIRPEALYSAGLLSPDNTHLANSDGGAKALDSAEQSLPQISQEHTVVEPIEDYQAIRLGQDSSGELSAQSAVGATTNQALSGSMVASGAGAVVGGVLSNGLSQSSRHSASQGLHLVASEGGAIGQQQSAFYLDDSGYDDVSGLDALDEQERFFFGSDDDYTALQGSRVSQSHKVVSRAGEDSSNEHDYGEVGAADCVQPVKLSCKERFIYKLKNLHQSWPWSVILTLAVILGVFMVLWGLVSTMSTYKLSTLGTITKATIVDIEDQYIHRKESRNLERVEHHFQEIIEFTLPDGTIFKTPLYLDGRLDATKVRAKGSQILVLYKSDEPHIVIDAYSLTPLWQGISALIGGVLLVGGGLWILCLFYVRLYRYHRAVSIFSLSVSSIMLVVSTIWIINYFNKSFVWLYEAVSYEDLSYDFTHNRYFYKKNNEPYSGLVRSFKDGIYTLSNFEDGRKDGIEYIYVAAEPMGYYHYRAGKLDGPYQSVDSFGHIESQGYYRGGHLDGRWVKYDAVKGGIAASGNWCWGAKDGTWSFYRADGSLYCREHYAQDLLNGEYKEFNPLGQLILETNYVKDIAHGTIIRYWPNGNKLYQATLENGIAHGDFDAYYANGNIFVSGTMRYGRWYEPPHVYNHKGVELDAAQKRLYRKSKDKQICTVKRAIALDYNLTFDEVGSAISMYKFRIGSEAYSLFDYELAEAYTDAQMKNNFSYFTVPDEASGYSNKRAKDSEFYHADSLLHEKQSMTQAPKGELSGSRSSTSEEVQPPSESTFKNSQSGAVFYPKAQDVDKPISTRSIPGRENLESSIQTDIMMSPAKFKALEDTHKKDEALPLVDRPHNLTRTAGLAKGKEQAHDSLAVGDEPLVSNQVPSKDRAAAPVKRNSVSLDDKSQSDGTDKKVQANTTKAVSQAASDALALALPAGVAIAAVLTPSDEEEDMQPTAKSGKSFEAVEPKANEFPDDSGAGACKGEQPQELKKNDTVSELLLLESGKSKAVEADPFSSELSSLENPHNEWDVNFAAPDFTNAPSFAEVDNTYSMLPKSDLEKLGERPSLSQSQALTQGKTNAYSISNKPPTTIRDFSEKVEHKSLNTSLDVTKVAQEWAKSNLAQFSYQEDRSLDKEHLPALAEVNPYAITWPNESLHLPPANRSQRADARNNQYVPFDSAIKGLLLIALHNWVGEDVVGIPGVDAPKRGGMLQYGDGVYSDTSFAWLRYPDNFIITVAVTRPHLQSSSVLVRGFENSLLRFDPYQVVYMTKKGFMKNHHYVPPYVISITYQYSPPK